MSGGAMTEAMIAMSGVNKWYGTFQVLTDISLTVRTGEKIVLCGPSGSGKSTLIRCINALESYQKGEIVVDGTRVNDSSRAIEAVRREVGMVFQQFNLFPHMTVLENCMLAPMRSRGAPRVQAEDTARRLLDRVKILNQAEKHPAQLSGGQQQRVAIARALHGAQGHAVRRTYLRARSRNGQGGARYHDRAGDGWHDHDLRHP
jgi:polar amino acid transport system ATP-binding protein